VAEPGQQVRLRIEKVVAGGDALARQPDGRIVFVPGALPGELVDVRILSAKRDLARGAVTAVIEPSAARRTPPCPRVAEGCGGCGWQHIDPAAQLDLKVAIAREALVRTGRLADAVVTAGTLLPSEAVRTSVRLAVAPDGRVGFRASRSHTVVPTDSCLVTHPLVDELIRTVRVRPTRVRDDDPPELRLRVGLATGERSAWLTGVVTGVIEGLPPDVAVGPDAVIHEDIAGHRFRVSAPAFFQSSPQGAEALVAAVRAAAGELASKAEHAVDAYAGGGLFAATVLGPGVRVTAIESSPAACADARINVPAATVVEVPVERWTPAPADLAIADPARAGLDKGGVAALTATGAERIVLVSCDPVALARDARLLAEQGYRHAGSEVFDLFPNTPHVEVVTRFDRE
jgi:23S rRNA (uracil1939-C5)-methyltransferase